MNETKLDISTPKEELPTKGFSVIVEAPQGYPIRDNARGKVIAVCAELDEATRIARMLASQPELLAALQEIAKHTDPADEKSYRTDDREGCLDTVHAMSKAAIAKIGGAQ